MRFHIIDSRLSKQVTAGDVRSMQDDSTACWEGVGFLAVGAQGLMQSYRCVNCTPNGRCRHKRVDRYMVSHAAFRRSSVSWTLILRI